MGWEGVSGAVGVGGDIVAGGGWRGTVSVVVVGVCVEEVGWVGGSVNDDQ